MVSLWRGESEGTARRNLLWNAPELFDSWLSDRVSGQVVIRTGEGAQEL